MYGENHQFSKVPGWLSRDISIGGLFKIVLVVSELFEDGGRDGANAGISSVYVMTP